MNSAEMDNTPNISYMTYGEIIKLVLDRKFRHDDTVINVLDQLKFAAQLLVDVNVAIEDRDIIPVCVEKSYGHIGNFEYYKNRMMSYFVIAFPIVTIAIFKYFWDKPDLRASVLRVDPNVDVVSMAINLCMIVAVSALVSLLPEVFMYIRVRYLWLKRYTPEGTIKYQLQEAKNRGYTEAGYYTDSVLEFLKSAYGLSAYDVGEDPCDNAQAWNNNPMLLASGLLKLIYAPLPDKKRQELSEKMKTVGNARYESKHDREKEIRDYIEREIKPPCTCYHKHIAKFILKNADKNGFELSLTYLNRRSEFESIGRDRLFKIAQEVVSAYDPTRAPNIPVKESTCTVHPVKKRNG